MRDERVENLAKILVQYSTKVEKGETCMIGFGSDVWATIQLTRSCLSFGSAR